MDKLAQYADIFGSARAAVLWAVGAMSSVNPYGSTTLGNMAVPETPPDAEPVDSVAANPALEGMNKKEKRTEAAAVVKQAREIIGCDWSVVTLYHSNDEMEKSVAAQFLAIRMADRYPVDYARLVCLRVGGVNVRSSLMAQVSCRSERTERRWRGEIAELLGVTYERAMEKL